MMHAARDYWRELLEAWRQYAADAGYPDEWLTCWELADKTGRSRSGTTLALMYARSHGLVTEDIRRVRRKDGALKLKSFYRLPGAAK